MRASLCAASACVWRLCNCGCTNDVSRYSSTDDLVTHVCVCVRLCACVCTCAYVCVHVYISLQGCQSVLMQVDAAALIDDERSCAHARVGVNLFDIKH